MTTDLQHVNRRILVVDDMPSVHEDFRKILARRSDSGNRKKLRAAILGGETNDTPAIEFEIDTAPQGEEGYRKVADAVNTSGPYAMAFVDMRMPPGWDGLETIERMWSVDPDLQVVVCTAYSDYTWEEIIARLGHSDRLLLLKKPFDNAEVWQLACALTEKWNLGASAKIVHAELEAMVERRTQQLQEANTRLKTETTEREQAEALALRFGHILDESLNEIYIFDAETMQFVRTNRGAQVNLGYSADELRQLTPLDLKPEYDANTFEELVGPLRRREVETIQFQTHHQRRDDSFYPVEVHLQLTEYGGRPAFAAIILDITQRVGIEDRLRHQAFHDLLTGLPNRALLTERLGRCLAQNERQPDYRYGILFLDLDNFKLINDSFGHEAGDELLVTVAARLSESLRAADLVTRYGTDTAARIGGDEFVILLEGIKHERDTAIVAERLLQAITAPCVVGGHEVVVNASIGITFCGPEYTKTSDVLRDADIAMYRAKGAGKAQYAMFDRAMHDDTMERLRIENDLRRAIAKRAFQLLYQPIVRLSDMKTVGLEGLIRWNHAEDGVIFPDRFIPIAEECGLIVPLGEWVIQEACSQWRRWADAYPDCRDLRTNVNLSPLQLASDNLIPTIRRALQEHDMPPSALGCEITESAVIEENATVYQRLQDIRELGASLHLDDFGTGYSSLSCLHRFPINHLKIDRAFTATMAENQDYAAIIQAIITLAHSLNMQVTVEGIETPEQLQRVIALGCDYAQGYLLAKPLPADAAIELARRGLGLPELASAATE